MSGMRVSVRDVLLCIQIPKGPRRPRTQNSTHSADTHHRQQDGLTARAAFPHPLNRETQPEQLPEQAKPC